MHKWRSKYSRHFLLFPGIPKGSGYLIKFAQLFAQRSTAFVIIKPIDGSCRDSELFPDLFEQAAVNRSFWIFHFQRPDSFYDTAAQFFFL
jgi:hypothetical protein